MLEGWRTHAQNKVSAEGTTYQAFDFVVRHGTLFLNATKSGTVVEVEALAAAELGAERALRNFLDELLPPEQREFTSSVAAFDGLTSPPPSRGGTPRAVCEPLPRVGAAGGEPIAQLAEDKLAGGLRPLSNCRALL